MIVAVGLVISWGQVGRKSQQSVDGDIILLQVEDDCRPRSLPCAAYAARQAFVLGPDRHGLRLVGQGIGNTDKQPIAEQFAMDGSVLGAVLIRQQDALSWFIELADPQAVGSHLSLRLPQQGYWLVAEFPIR